MSTMLVLSRWVTYTTIVLHVDFRYFFCEISHSILFGSCFHAIARCQHFRGHNYRAYTSYPLDAYNYYSYWYGRSVELDEMQWVILAWLPCHSVSTYKFIVLVFCCAERWLVPVADTVYDGDCSYTKTGWNRV